MQSQPWALALGKLRAAWPICASCRRALSSVVELTAWLHILPLPGPCFLLECLERQRVSWLHLCHGNELGLGGGAQPCSEFGPPGRTFGSWLLLSPGLGLGAFWDLPDSSLASGPVPYDTPNQRHRLHQHPNWRPPDLCDLLDVYLSVHLINHRVPLVLPPKHLSLLLSSVLDIPTCLPQPQPLFWDTIAKTVFLKAALSF